jgi:hypothetical protein
MWGRAMVRFAFFPPIVPEGTFESRVVGVHWLGASALILMKTNGERRSGARIPTSVPTRVRTREGEEHSAQTRDVSANGVFLFTKSRMEPGSEVELVLILPPELTLGEKCWVCCQATIVRVEESGGQFGVAAKIQRMDILPEIVV